MDFIRYDIKKSLDPNGFQNLGFTCYFNALLQSLITCTSFVEVVLKVPANNDKFLYMLQVLIKYHIYPTKDDISSTAPLVWREMITKLSTKNKEFAKFAIGQQCAAEGFSLLLMALEEYPAIQRLFTYRRKNLIKCPECTKIFSDVRETHNILEIEPNTLTDSFNENLLHNLSEVDSDCICTACKVKGEKERISELTMVPEILFVMIKKYTFDQTNRIAKKDNALIGFPETLKIKSTSNTYMEYKAIAQIEHLGSMNGGHYYAVCKRKGQWFCINDNLVSKHTYLPTQNTYIVIYHIQ